MTIRIVVVPFLLLFASFVQAQDTLFYANGDTIVGQVEEVGKDDIRYRITSSGNPVVITVDKSELASVQLASGQRFVYREASGHKGASGYSDRVNLVSIDFIAPAFDHFTIGYERSLSPRLSIGVKAGFISLGIYDDYFQEQKPTGFLLKTGANFFLPPSQKRQRAGGALNPLVGWYLGPELIVSAWSEANLWYYDGNSTSDYLNLCLDVVIGRKLALGERLTFDLYGGVGYGLQWENGEFVASSDRRSGSSGNGENYSYAFTFMGNSPLILSGGLMFGYLFE